MVTRAERMWNKDRDDFEIDFEIDLEEEVEKEEIEEVKKQIDDLQKKT